MKEKNVLCVVGGKLLCVWPEKTPPKYQKKKKKDPKSHFINVCRDMYVNKGQNYKTTEFVCSFEKTSI